MPTISPQENTKLWIILDSKSHDGSMPIDINIYRSMNGFGKLVDKYTSPMDPSRLPIPTFHDLYNLLYVGMRVGCHRGE